jgi:hypothetical protein
MTPQSEKRTPPSTPTPTPLSLPPALPLLDLFPSLVSHSPRLVPPPPTGQVTARPRRRPAGGSSPSRRRTRTRIASPPAPTVRPPRSLVPWRHAAPTSSCPPPSTAIGIGGGEVFFPAIFSKGECSPFPAHRAAFSLPPGPGGVHPPRSVECGGLATSITTVVCSPGLRVGLALIRALVHAALGTGSRFQVHVWGVRFGSWKGSVAACSVPRLPF